MKEKLLSLILKMGFRKISTSIVIARKKVLPSFKKMSSYIQGLGSNTFLTADSDSLGMDPPKNAALLIIVLINHGVILSKLCIT